MTRERGERVTEVQLRFALLGLLALLAATFASPAAAEVGRTTITAEFGPDGTSATSFTGPVAQLDFNQDDGELVAMTNEPREIHTFEVGSPGTFTPVPGGNFPAGGSGRAQATVHTATGNIYVATRVGQLFAYTPTGSPLPGFPINDFASPLCGVEFSAQDEMWVSELFGGKWTIMTPFGETLRTQSLGGQGEGPCQIEFDSLTADLYMINSYEHLSRLYYEHDYDSGYRAPGEFYESDGSKDLAFDAVTNRALTATEEYGPPRFDEWTTEGYKAYELPLPGTVGGVAVGPDGTAYLGVGHRIVEIPLATIPSATTGESIGATEVSGTVDLNGAGPITTCYFQWGASDDYTVNTNKTPCAEATPFSSQQEVTAELPGLTAGDTYHYRLVAGNVNRGGFDYGADETIAPPLVTDLSTNPASSVTRT